MKKRDMNLEEHRGVYESVWRRKGKGGVMSLYYNLKKNERNNMEMGVRLKKDKSTRKRRTIQ